MLVCTFGDSPGEIALSWTLPHQCHHFHPCQRPKRDQMPGVLQCSAKLWGTESFTFFWHSECRSTKHTQKKKETNCALLKPNLTDFTLQKHSKKRLVLGCPTRESPTPRMASFQFSSCWSNPDPDGHWPTVRPGVGPKHPRNCKEMASTEPTSRIHPYIHIPVIIWQVPFSHASQFYSFHFFSELGYNLWTEELHVPLCGDVKDIMSHIELNASCDTCECMLGWVSDSEDMLQCSTVPWCKNHKKTFKIHQNISKWPWVVHSCSWISPWLCTLPAVRELCQVTTNSSMPSSPGDRRASPNVTYITYVAYVRDMREGEFLYLHAISCNGTLECNRLLLILQALLWLKRARQSHRCHLHRTSWITAACRLDKLDTAWLVKCCSRMWCYVMQPQGSTIIHNDSTSCLW